MKRQLLTLALAGVLCALWAADASACCHKKKGCHATACVAVEPCPPPPPPPPPPPSCEKPKHCGLFHHNAGCGHKRMGCHKKASCAPVVCETPVVAPVYAPAPYYAAPSFQASPQASHQGY